MNTDTNEQTSIFDGIADPSAVRRKDMIPKWIRVFCWIFAVLAPIGALGAIVNFVSNIHIGSELYGFASNDAISNAIIGGVSLLKACTAIGLLMEKDWAVRLAIADGIIGIILCIFSMVYGLMHSIFQLRLELFVLTPYLVIMRSIRKDWEANRYAIQQAASAE